VSSSLERRAHRLVALYPRPWRERFGDEFEQLLLDELHDHPRSLRRTADVTAHATLAHLTHAGLVGRGLAADAQTSRGLRALGAVVALFLVVATAIWSGLDVGWTWAAPTAQGTRVAIITMSVALLGMFGLVAVAAVLIGPSVARALRHGSAAHRWPLLVLTVCGLAFAIGCVHFASQWPGGRKPGWGQHSIVPAGLARFAWAGTQWVTAYWLHPDALRTLPDHRLMWSVLSPLLLIATAVAAFAATRSLIVSPAITRALAVTAAVAGMLGALFVVGAASWILSAGTGPRQVFQPGSVDLIALVVLALALVGGAHIMSRLAAAYRHTPRL
jgi:hypothetical protein